MLRNLRTFRQFLCLLTAAPILAAGSETAVLTVTNTTDNGSGSLRQVIATASPGTTIRFDIPSSDAGCTAGVCKIVLTSGEVPITKGLAIQGPGADVLVVSGNHAWRIFDITATSAVDISGMTLRDGAPIGGSFGGGAILINTSSNVTPINLHELLITNNNVTTTGNPLGGGIDNEGGTVTIERSAIVNNIAAFRGGGIQNQGFGSMTIVNSTIAGNTAGTTGIGGAIRSLLPLTLTNCTIYGNSAQSAGNISRVAGTVNFQNTIIAGGILIGTGGSAPDISGAVNSLDYNLIQDITGATITGATTHNIVGFSPLLSALANNGGPTPTMAPSALSPVIDAGSAVPGMTTDQRGFYRVVDFANIANAGDGSDIGAFELEDEIFANAFEP